VNLTSILHGPYFRRIHLPRTRVHRGKKKRRGEKLRPGE